MGRSRLFEISAILLLLASACKQPAAAVTPEKEPRAHKAKEGKGRAEAKANSDDGKGDEKAEKADESPQKYIVPFAWETSKGEPLALTRAFLKESFEDNKTYMEHGPKFFSAFADAELPRATVITCSDSRVQPQAWDETSENDDYTVRNFGNTLAGDEGSIEYGVEHLQTPLLLIIGHTGCGAVKAASGDTSKLSKSMQARLKNLQIPRPTAGKNDNQVWADAVIANVHNQVALALKKYGKRVQGGALTVVGALFDFRNDLGQGAGKFMIVDVNGNGEPERMEAFMAAINEGPTAGKHGKKHARDSLAPEEAIHSLEQVKGIITREVAAASNDSANVGHVD
ncbi:MAG TPA: carbonic anhydrase [Polyangiaceae bacterium]|nr:carbonic anhydrase [Polyangiaceae bacterium]